VQELELLQLELPQLELILGLQRSFFTHLIIICQIKVMQLIYSMIF
jgi:hypothetical protein